MKKIIRRNVFETNSSTTHSLTFMHDDEYKKLINNELYIGDYDGILYTKERRDEMIKKAAEGNMLTEEEVLEMGGEFFIPVSYEEYMESEWLETDVNMFTTRGGEKIVVICKYGRDG